MDSTARIHQGLAAARLDIVRDAGRARCSMPSVQPDTCGVIRTLGKLVEGLARGSVEAGRRSDTDTTRRARRRQIVLPGQGLGRARPLVDDLGAGDIDEDGGRLHQAQLALAEQPAVASVSDTVIAR
jgi:hypothetical protein